MYIPINGILQYNTPEDVKISFWILKMALGRKNEKEGDGWDKREGGKEE